MLRPLRFAHSSDSDQAFLFYALSRGLVDTRGWEIRPEIHPLETLNQSASDGLFDITSLSFHAYAYLLDRYSFLSAGATVVDGVGPRIVSRRSLTSLDLEDCIVAIPGERATATLVLRLYCPAVRTRVIPLDQIAPEVAKGNLDAGLLTQDGQFPITDLNLRRVIDLGEWWKMETGLPLPLVGTAIRKTFGQNEKGEACDLVRSSVRYALEHRQEALAYALSFTHGLDPTRASQCIGTAVQGLALEIGERAEQAVALLLKLGHEKGLLPHLVTPEFVD